MLESVSIKIAVVQRLVGQDEIIKRHHLNVEIVLLFRHFLRHRPDFLVNACAYAHFDVVGVLLARFAGGQQQRACDNQRYRDFF